MSESLTSEAKQEFTPERLRLEVSGAEDPTAAELERWFQERRLAALAPYYGNAHQAGALPQEVVTVDGQLKIATVATHEISFNKFFYLDGIFVKGAVYDESRKQPTELLNGRKEFIIPTMSESLAQRIAEFYADNYDSAQLAPVKTYPGIYPVRVNTVTDSYQEGPIQESRGTEISVFKGASLDEVLAILKDRAKVEARQARRARDLTYFTTIQVYCEQGWITFSTHELLNPEVFSK